MTLAELTLEGTPRERGLAHGETLRTPIHNAIDAWFSHLSKDLDPHAFTTDLTRNSGLLDAAQTHAPDLVEELEAISQSAAIPFEAIFAWQLIDECWWYQDDLAAADKPAERCSAFAVNDQDQGIVGQTQDLYRHYDGHHVMLRYIDPDGLEILAPSLAGLLAFNGVNSSGLAIAITTLSQLEHSPTGLGSGLLVMRLLRCRSVEEALDLLARVPIASGNSFLLGTRDRSVAVEVSAAAITVVDDGAQALHTNHVLAQTPTRDYLRFASSKARLSQLQASIEPFSSLADIEAAYGTGPICESRSGNNDVLSVGTMFFELGDTQRCHYAPGPLDSDKLSSFDMNAE